MGEESALSALKQILIGKPIPSHLAHHERLSKTTGLAVHNQRALLIKGALLFKPNTVVTSVPFHLKA